MGLEAGLGLGSEFGPEEGGFEEEEGACGVGACVGGGAATEEVEEFDEEEIGVVFLAALEESEGLGSVVRGRVEEVREEGFHWCVVVGT